MNNNGGGSSAPTGCYKCGRPGHWSRDCPSDPTQNPTDTTNPNPTNPNPKLPFQKKPLPAEKPKRVPRSRPKLTPDLLLSEDGIGVVLKHFPKAFKYHGRGREVKDFGNLLGLYAEWHSQLLPYYSFDQFVHKVEQVGSTRRVKLSLGGLRDRVANGGDLTKLHDSPAEDNPNSKEETMNSEDPGIDHEVMFNRKNGTDTLEEDMLHEIYDQATEVPNPSNVEVTGAADVSPSHSNSTKSPINEASTKDKQVLDEQKARMEANRLKALERAAARKLSKQVS